MDQVDQPGWSSHPCIDLTVPVVARHMGGPRFLHDLGIQGC